MNDVMAERLEGYFRVGLTPAEGAEAFFGRRALTSVNQYSTSGRYLHAAVEVKRPCSGSHFMPLDWLAVAVAVAVGSPQLTIKF
jgi:hypothetical protein